MDRMFCGGIKVKGFMRVRKDEDIWGLIKMK